MTSVCVIEVSQAVTHNCSTVGTDENFNAIATSFEALLGYYGAANATAVARCDKLMSAADFFASGGPSSRVARSSSAFGSGAVLSAEAQIREADVDNSKFVASGVNSSEKTLLPWFASAVEVAVATGKLAINLNVRTDTTGQNEAFAVQFAGVTSAIVDAAVLGAWSKYAVGNATIESSNVISLDGRLQPSFAAWLASHNELRSTGSTPEEGPGEGSPRARSPALYCVVGVILGLLLLGVCVYFLTHGHGQRLHKAKIAPAVNPTIQMRPFAIAVKHQAWDAPSPDGQRESSLVQRISLAPPMAARGAGGKERPELSEKGPRAPHVLPQLQGAGTSSACDAPD